MYYVIDVTKPFGHYGRYPAPVAKLIAKLCRRFGLGDIDYQTRADYLLDMSWNAKHYTR